MSTSPSYAHRSPDILDLSISSGASAGTIIGTPLIGLLDYRSIAIEASIAGTDGTASGGTVDVYLQISSDGVIWSDYVHFAQAASGAAAVIYRCVPTLGGTITTIGQGTGAGAGGLALAAGTLSGGHWGTQIRAVVVSGAGANHATLQTIKIHAVPHY